MIFLGRRDKKLLKIADFPEDDMKVEAVIPAILEELKAIIPFTRHLMPDGPMNLVRVKMFY